MYFETVVDIKSRAERHQSHYLSITFTTHCESTILSFILRLHDRDYQIKVKTDRRFLRLIDT